MNFIHSPGKMAQAMINMLMIALLTGATACQIAVATPPSSHSTQNRVAEPSNGEAQETQAVSPAAESAELWLDRIEAFAATVQTLQAQLTYDRIQRLVGDRQRRFGTLVYEAGPPGRFAVHFDRTLVDRRLDHDDRRYIFDGHWLIERYDRDKLLIKRQIAAPPAPGQAQRQADPLALGAGPFALPIKLKKQVILERFDVQLIEPIGDDPATTVHLHLVPKAGHVSDLTHIDLWYNRQTRLPERISTVDPSDNESVIQLSQVVINKPVDRAAMDTSVPTQRGWRVEIKPWEDKPRTQ